MPSYKLNYFEARGLGEVSRQLFLLSGTAYEDNRISKTNWGPESKSKYPFGTLPVLEVDGKQIPQSLAIARYLAKEFGYAGKTAFEAAWVDAIADQFKDMVNEVRPYLMAVMSNAADKDKLFKEVAEPAIEKHLGALEKVAKKNGSGFFVGSSVTYVDLLVADFIVTFEGFLPKILEPYPALQKIRKTVQALPQIKAWIAKRPVTAT